MTRDTTPNDSRIGKAIVNGLLATAAIAIVLGMLSRAFCVDLKPLMYGMIFAANFIIYRRTRYNRP